MEKREDSWTSEILSRDMKICIYGHGGLPILAFPTRYGSPYEWEQEGAIDVLAPWIEAGKVAVFTVDAVDHETWFNHQGDIEWRANRQEAYYEYIIDEVFTYIQQHGFAGVLPVCIGSDIGGLTAMIMFLRRPELFSGVLSMSATYDAKIHYDGWLNRFLYDNSPVDFLPNMSEMHPYISLYNTKKIAVCTGQSFDEQHELVSTQDLARILWDKHIHAWVDYWGEDSGHNWYWWKLQLEHFLPWFLGERE